MSAGPTQNYEEIQEGSNWTSRPVLARALRTTVLLLPIAGSFVVTWLAAHYFPPSDVGVNVVVWWIGVLVVATAVMFAIERIARRGLPLVALLKMSLVFPEEAPSRFSTALRTGTTKQLERRVEEMRLLGLHDSDEVTYGQQMLELIAALNTHDRLTRGHCERVRAYTDMIIEELKIPDADANKLRWSALLHDVGKIMVPAAIINKEGRPTADEWEILKSHAAEGQRMVAPIASWLGEWSRSVGEHHERWDGDGYPNGFAANEIHLGARIVAVADAFDVMTSARSYKKPMPTEAAREEVARCSGSQFDPDVVRAFLNIGIGRLRLAMGPLTWLANIPSAGQIPIAPVASPLASVVTSAIGVTAAIASGAVGAILPEDFSTPEPVAAFVDEEPLGTTVPPTTLAPVITIPVAAVSSVPATTSTTVAPTTTTTTTTTAPVVNPSPTSTAAPAPTTTVPMPVGNDSTVNIDEDNPVTLSLSGASGSGAPTFEIIISPLNGALTKVAGGTISGTVGEELWEYTPNPNFSGADGFRYQVCDDRGVCDVAEVLINIAPKNDAPVSAPDQVAASEDAPIAIPVSDLLGNDTDVDLGDDPELESFSQPANGTITTDASGNLLYAPDPGFHGTDTFTYTITDGEISVTETVTVEVASVADAPVAIDDSFSTDEDNALVLPVATILANDSDPDPADTPVLDGYNQPANGTVTTSVTGDLVYAPDANFSGTDTFTYTISDGALAGTATVTITVTPINDPPVAVDDTFTTDEDTALPIPVAVLLTNDSDPENTPTVDSYTQPANGTATTSVTGDLVYIPYANFNGSDSFTYTITDGALTDTATVTITVTPINDPPVALDNNFTTSEDTTLSLPVSTLLANDSDIESTPTLDSATQPANGTITTVPSGDLAYTPDPEFHGTDTFTYTITDGALTDTATITVVVAPVNDRPTGSDDSGFTIDQRATLTIPLTTLLANDSDTENDALTAANITSSATDGVVTLSADGLSVEFVSDVEFAGTTSFKYDACETTGLCESSPTTVTIVVNNVNDAPVAVDDVLPATAEDTPTAFTIADLQANDEDPDFVHGTEFLVLSIPGSTVQGGTLSITAGGDYLYTPPLDYFGPDQFTYLVTDAAGTPSNTATVTIEVTTVPEPPEATNDGSSTSRFVVEVGTPTTVPDVRTNDTDDDDNLATLTVNTPAATSAGGQLSTDANGVITYQPLAGFDGPDHFNYTLTDSDGLTSQSATVYLSVENNVNQTPFGHPESFTTPEDIAITMNWLGTNGILTNDSDADLPYGDQLAVVSVNTTGTNGTVVIDSVAATVTFTPTPSYNGDTSFTYTACDLLGDCTNPTTVDVTVTAVGDNPIAEDDGYVVGGRWNAPQATSVTVAVADLKANDFNPDDPFNSNGGALTYSLPVQSFSGIQVVQPSVGSDFLVTADADFIGDATFDYKVCNLSGLCDTATVTVLVTDVNFAPVATVSVPHNATTPFLGAEDTDWVDIVPTVTEPLDIGAGDNHTWSIPGATPLPAGLTLNPATGIISGRPAIGSSGSYTLTMSVTDDSAANPGPLSAQFQLTIVIVDWELSELHGDWLISEVRYRETAADSVKAMEKNWADGAKASVGILDEFIEIVNVSGGPLDLASLTFTDQNPKELDASLDPVLDGVRIQDPFDPTRALVFNSRLQYTAPTRIVADGEHVVLWLTARNQDFEIYDPENPTVLEFEYHVPGFTSRPVTHQLCICGPASLLGNAADEVFVIDNTGRLVDFVAWDDGTASGEEKSAYPTNLDPSIGPNIPGNAAPGRSGSLAHYNRPATELFSSPACWELTGSGTATCPGATATGWSGPANVPHESYGDPNYPGAP